MSTRSTLENYFETDDIPTAAQFVELIASFFNLTDDDLSDIPGLIAALEAKADLVGGYIPTSQLPSGILGALSYQSGWNANTNTPAIPLAATGNKGHYYVVTTAGSTTINGENDWKVKDWIVSNGSAWEKVDNTETVTSVAAKTGVVTLIYSDISGDIPQSKITNLLTDIGDIQADIIDLENSRGRYERATVLSGATYNEAAEIGDLVIECDCSTGNITVNLDINNKRRNVRVIVSNAGANTVTINPGGATTFEGSGLPIVLNATYAKQLFIFTGGGTNDVYLG